ncbi:syntaxin binding protein 1, partial [Coemansia sp. RSA 2603]
FVNALIAVRPSNRFKIVVVDKRSLQILNKVLKLPEVLEHDVVRIDRIENGRKEDPTMDALYFLTPSKQSVNNLISDFQTASSQRPPVAGSRGTAPVATRKQPQYRAAYVYFTSELSDQLLKTIKSSGISPYIKALNELCIEYEVHDQHVFLTQLANRPLYRMYSPIVSKGINDELELISKKLANVCGALKENPVVRYLLLDQNIYGDTKARPLAFLFHTEMERIREGLPQEEANDGKQPTELIIVDRSADPFAPILHEFTYEAMVYDLLDIEDGNKYSYTVELGNGSEETKTVVLNDSDPIWQEYRFQHISDAQEGILAKFNGLVGSNRAIVDLQSGQKMDVGRLRDVVGSMPQFKDQLSLISAHIDMMQKCMDEFKRRNLEELGLLEQNLVTGKTADGEKYSSGDIDIAYVLNNHSIEPHDKMRLLLLFFIANPSLTEPERQKLAHLAKFSRESREAIKNMGLVIRWTHALDLLKQLKHKPGQEAKSSKWSLAGMRAKPQDDDEEKPYDLSRYTPGFKSVLENCVEGILSEDLFPYVVPPERPRDSNPFAAAGSARSTPGLGQGNDRSASPASSMWSNLVSSVGLQTPDSRPPPGAQGANSGAARQIKSLRSAKPTWQKRDSSPSVGGAGGYGGGAAAISPVTPLSGTSAGVSPMGQAMSRSRTRQNATQSRIILFVIGGVTFSEVRAAQEVAQKHGREVIVGSTHMIEPDGYLKDISSLSFNLVGDNGLPIYMDPSFLVLGYGCPPHIDPLKTFDEDLIKDPPKEKKSKPKEAPPVSTESAQRGSKSSDPRHGSSHAPDDERRSRHRSDSGERGHSRGESRNAHRSHGYYQDSASSQRSHGSEPPPQQRSAGRLDAYPSSSSGSSMRSSANQRGASEAPPRSASRSRDQYGFGDSHRPLRNQRSGHFGKEEPSYEPLPPYQRTERPQQAEPQNFRAGYEEYRQQQQRQQQQAAMRSKSLHSSSSTSSHSYRSSPQPQPQQRQQPVTQQSKEDLFRAKFEKSQNEWNSQKMNLNYINPDNVSDMHKVTLAPSGGNSGRGRSGSSASADRKATGFLKRYL